MKPVPSKHCRQRQGQPWRLLQAADGSTHNAAVSIMEQLEAEFVQAWGLSEDSDGVSLELKMMAARNRSNFDHCLDHCTCYFESATQSHVVVTQPYLEPGQVVESLTHGFVASGGVKPEIIAAPEWAFYYPGRATLIVVKFPPGYERILKALDRLWSPAAQWSLGRN